MLNQKSVAIVLVSLGVIGCSSQTTREWRPYNGTTPSVQIEYAQDVCEVASERARSAAENDFEEQEVVTSSKGGAIVGSLLNSLNKTTAGSGAYNRSFKGCMAEYGFQLYTVKKTD